MAKIKRWVVYVIISAILGLSLIGLGVGLYYCFKPLPLNPNKPTVYPLSPEQQKFVDTLNSNDLNIGSSYYGKATFEDGTLVDFASIDKVFGNIAIIKNSLGIPEFYTFKADTKNLNKFANSPTKTISNAKVFANSNVNEDQNYPNLIFTKINIKVDYQYLAETSDGELYISSNFVIVKNNGNKYFIVSLKTGETIMDATKYFVLQSDDATYMTSGEILLFSGNWLVVTETTQIKEESVAKLSKTTSVINLQDISQSKDFVYAIEFDISTDPQEDEVTDFTYSSNHTNEQYVYSSVDNGYLILVTTKFTNVFAPNLIDGSIAEAISPIANNFTLAQNQDANFQSNDNLEDNFGITICNQKYSKIEYSFVYYLPNNTFLIEKNLITENFSDNNSQAIGKDIVFEDYNSLSTYFVYSIANCSFIDSGSLDTNCKIKVIDSNVDGFILVLEDRFNLNITPAAYYDYNFNKIISYDYGSSGKVIEYNSKDGFFVTSSDNASGLIDIMGVNRVSFPGYKVYSKTTTNNFIILCNNNNYILYNTLENQYYNYNFSMVTQITDGKLIGYKQNDCFYLVDLLNGKIDPLPYIDKLSVNTLIGSLGYYVELIEGNYYLTTTNGKIVSKQIERIDYNQDIKVMDGKVYTLIKSASGQSVIVSDFTCNFGTYSLEELLQNFSINKDYFTNDTATTTAYFLDPNYNFGIQVDPTPAEKDDVDNGSYNTTISGLDKNFSWQAPKDNITGNGTYEITPTFSMGVKFDKSVPSYSINVDYAKNMATNGALLTSGNYIDAQNYGISFKDYDLRSFAQVKEDFPLKENCVLDKNYDGSDYIFNNGCFVCASKYYTPYGCIYIVRLKGYHSNYGYIGTSKDFVILELDKSTYVDGTMTYQEYDPYNINRKTTRQFIPIGTSYDYNKTEAYNKLKNSVFVGGITSGGYDNNQVKQQIKTSSRLLTEPNAHLLKSGRDNSKYVEIYYQEFARTNWDHTTLNINISTTMENVSVTNLNKNFTDTATGLSYWSSYKDNGEGKNRVEESGSLTFTGFNFSNGFYPYINLVANDDVYNSDINIFNSSDPYKNESFDIRELFTGLGAQKYGAAIVYVGINSRHWLLDFYDISGTVTFQTVTKDYGKTGFWATGNEVASPTKNDTFNVQDLLGSNKGLRAEDGIIHGWFNTDYYSRDVHYVGIYSAEITLKLKTSENTGYYHINTAVENPATSDAAKDNDTGETLFVYRDGFNVIQYGFVTQKNFVGNEYKYIGSKRTDLSIFTNKGVTNGYTATFYGPKATRNPDNNAIKAYNMADGKLAAPQSGINYMHMSNFAQMFKPESNGRHVAPVQEAIQTTFNFNYIDANYIGNFELSPTDGNYTSANWWAESWTDSKETKPIQNVSYDSKITVPTYGIFGSGSKNNGDDTGNIGHVAAPRGYNIIGWNVNGIEYYNNNSNKLGLIGSGESFYYHGFKPENGKTEINVYAVYQKKSDYNLSFDSTFYQNSEGLLEEINTSGIKLYWYNNGSLTEFDLTTSWLNGVTYHSKITVPILYAKTAAGVYYKVNVGLFANSEAGNSSGGYVNAEGDQSARTVWFTYNNLLASYDNNTLQEYFDGSINNFKIKLILTPQKYNFNFAGSIDNHVYKGEQGTLHDTIVDDFNITFNETSINLESKNYTYSNYDSEGNYSKDVLSGADYIIEITNFLIGFDIKFKFSYNYTDTFNNDLKVSTWYHIFKSGNDYYIENKKDEQNAIWDNKVKVNFEGTELFDVLENSRIKVEINEDQKTLTLTFTALHGYFEVEEQVSGKFTGNISITDFAITTQPYNISLNIKDEDDTNLNTSLNNLNSGKYSLSELINGVNNKDKVLGLGSTVLVNLRNDLAKPLYPANVWVLNEYLTGLSIKFNDQSYMIGGINDIDGLRDEVADLLKMISQEISLMKPTNNVKEADFINFKDSNNNTIVTSNNIKYFIKMLYDLNDNQYDEFIEHSMMYSILKVELINKDKSVVPAYIILTNHETMGVSVGVMFNVEDSFVWGKNSNSIELSITKKIYKNNVDVEFTNNGSALDANGNISLDWKSAYKHGPITNGEQATNLFNEGELQKYNLVGSNASTSTRFENISPSNSLSFNINAKNGYYFSALQFSYNNNNYLVEFAGYTINSSQTIIKPTYNIYILNSENQKSLLETVSFDSEKENITSFKIENLYLNIDFYTIGMESNAQTLARVTFGNVKNACNIVVHYGAYTLLSVNAPESKQDGTTEGINSIGYTVSGGDISIYEKDENSTLNRAISKITFSDYSITTNALDVNKFKIYATAYNGNIFAELGSLTNNNNNWTTNGNQIYFMVVNYCSRINIESTLSENASYSLSVNKSQNNILNNTTATPSAEGLVLTNFSIENTVGNSRLVSYILKPKHIATTITSDINFGTNQTPVIYEESKEQINNTGILYPSIPKFLDSDKFYNVGENGQIASDGTKINYTNANFGNVVDENYYQYGNTYNVYGNTLKIKANSVYGYALTGITLRINITVNSVNVNGYKSFTVSEFANASKDENGYADVSFSVMVGESQKTIHLGKYKVEELDNAANLTIIIENLQAELFEAKLNYKAKEFDITYDTAQSFGSSPVNEGLNIDTSITEGITKYETRTYVYNVRGNVDSSSKASAEIYSNTNLKEEDNTVIYSRLGYNLIGWTFNEYFGDYGSEDNNVKYKGKKDNGSTNLNELTRYFVQSDAGESWYNYITVTNQIFGADNSTESGLVTMYAIWDAKDYTINLNYNDSSQGNGSSQSTKFSVSWKFDMPVTVSGFNQDSLNFSGLKLLSNTINSVYRLGYTFNGWYIIGGNDNLCVYSGNQQEGSHCLNFDYTYYKDNILGQRISSWTEGETSTDIDKNTHNRKVSESIFTLQAEWTANTYSLLFDLNVGLNQNGSGNISGIKINNTNNSVLAYNVEGLGSSLVTLAKNDSAIVSVTFDSQLPSDFGVYAYRYGYKFSGWYFTRGDGSFAYINNKDLAEGKQFDADLLIKLLGAKDSQKTTIIESVEYTTIIPAQLNAIIDKYSIQSANNQSANAIETLYSYGATISVGGNTQTVENLGNVLLLHARWEALNYYINIDLNNWNHKDYAWDDADYMVGSNKISGDSQSNSNIVNPNYIYYKVTFDSTFGEGSLYIGGVALQTLKNDKGEYYYYINGNKYSARGTDYQILTKILTSYGYNLGVSYADGVYHFSLQGDGVDNSIGSDSLFAINANRKFDSGFMQNMYFFNTLFGIKDGIQSIDWSNENSLLLLDYSGSDKGDLHKIEVNNIDVGNWQTQDDNWGRRTFTIFALWTLKTDNIYNLGYDISYGGNNAGSNNLELGTTKTEIISKTDESNYTNFNYNAGDQKLYVYSPSLINNKENNNLSANALTYYNNADINFVAPSGLYTQELMLTFTDTNNQVMGQLKLQFAWNKINRTINIVSAQYRLFTYVSGNVANSEYGIAQSWQTVDASIVTDKSTGLSTISIPKLNYMFEHLIVETTNYKVTADTATITENSKNVNNNYRYEIEDDGYGALDVNFILLHLINIKGNVYFSAINKAQTYDVDYYRYIRPTNGMQTHIDENQESDFYGLDVWDSEFLNNWNCYEVYKTETYRYGEYANVSYSYASGFAFDNWYNYQGHLAIDQAQFNKYQNYSANDTSIYTVDKSGNIAYNNMYDFIGSWDIAEYTWDALDKVYKKSNGAEFGDETLAGRLIVNPDNSQDYAPYKDKDTDILTIYLHKYNNNADYIDYKYLRSPVSSNLSLVGVYNPAAINQAHYYVWSGNKYVERDVSSVEYVLGQKKFASVSGVLTNSGIQDFNYIEYWQLGTNDQYYRVGFGGIENNSATNAVAFLLQFVNPDNYFKVLNKNYNDALDKQGKLSLSWQELKTIILNGISVNGITTKISDANLSVIDFATALLKQMLIDGYNRFTGADQKPISPTEGYDIYKYLNNYQVVKYMGYANIKENTNDVKNNVYITLSQSLGLSINASVADIINNFNLNALNVLLDNIAIDYFGFVVKNPTNTIGSWPTNTYFAGWYLVDSALKDELIGNALNGVVLTYNHLTWGEDLKTLYTPSIITGKSEDADGNITYTLTINGKDYLVTRFNAVNPYTGEADVLSRVNGDSLIFAAYNAQRFTMSEDGCTDADVQMGTNVADIDGNIYQYNSGDVRYVVLNQTQFDAFMTAKSNNNNNPTALRMALQNSIYNVYGNRLTTSTQNKTTINYSYFIGDTTNPKDARNENIFGNLEDAKQVAKNGGYIFAFVYQVNKIEPIPVTDNTGNITINLNIYYINYIVNVASQYGYFNQGNYMVNKISDYIG